jgi:aromatic ring-opening dioxygenase catalytic subunit (LigB family)
VITAATVHFPYITGWPERALANDRKMTLDGFERLGKAFRDADVNTIIAFTSEHIVNLQPRLSAPFLIGVGECHEAFHEPHFNLEPTTRAGDPELAHYLVSELYREGFDVAHSSELLLDHGTTLPLSLMKIESHVTVIPVIINSIFPPLPTLTRCRALGTAVTRVLGRSSLARRIGILATGGISHTVGAPGVDSNDPAFDTAFLRALSEGDLDKACSYSDESLDAVGNGTHEIRNWIAAAGASQPRRPITVTSIAHARGWNSGVHQFIWEEK